MTAQPSAESAGSPPARRGPARRRVVKWVRIALVVFSLALAALVVSTVIELNGGIPWAFTTAPTAADKEVVAANSAGDLQRDKLVSVLQEAGAVTGLARVTSSIPTRYCDKGQHNWKIHNDYDLTCSTSVTLILGSSTPTGPAARTQLLAFHDQLVAKKWFGATADRYFSSIKRVVDTRTTSGMRRPPLDEAGAVFYEHGRGGGPGSARMLMSVTDNQDEWGIKMLKGAAYGQSALSYLQGRPDRYLLDINLTYQTFRK